MQPSKDSNGNLVEYGYGYREYLKNKRNKTYNRNLINKVVDKTKNIYSNGRGFALIILAVVKLHIK